jgi:hypothetical protein
MTIFFDLVFSFTNQIFKRDSDAPDDWISTAFAQQEKHAMEMKGWNNGLFLNQIERNMNSCRICQANRVRCARLQTQALANALLCFQSHQRITLGDSFNCFKEICLCQIVKSVL